MDSLEPSTQDAPRPTEEGWIALAPAHLIPWVLLLLGLLNALLFAVLPYGFPVRKFMSWGFILVNWTLGGLAFASAFRARAERLPGTLRQTAFGLASAALGLRICLTLGSQLAPGVGLYSYSLWMFSYPVMALLGLSALILVLAGHEEDAGGGFDAAVAALAMASGSGWLALPVLVIAAMKRHPLLSALWQALRAPDTAVDGAWFDALDEAQRQGNYGACALALALSFLALAARLLSSGFNNFSVWWFWTDMAAALLAGLLLGIHVVRSARRTGERKGRGLAIAAILVSSLPLLLLLAAGFFLVLIATDVIHFRLF